MAKPSKSINMGWSPSLAYVLGIIATDGYVSKDGRHISITSKDLEIVQNCKQALGIDNSIGVKNRIKGGEKKYFVLQFGSVVFCNFLYSIGITNNKSKTISRVEVPPQYYVDFFRGCIDGDGSITVSHHPESSHPQLKLRLASASSAFLTYIHTVNQDVFDIKGGWIIENKPRSIYTLVYGKQDSIQILKKMYNTECSLRLNRKYLIAQSFIE